MKIRKKILILVLLILVIIVLPKTCIASTISTDDYVGGTRLGAGETTEIAAMTSDILATIRNVGAIISVVVIAVIGIKYMLGSLEEKASYKENMILYVAGCFILMMATTIPSIVYKIMK